MRSKQDRQGVRTAPELERKYDFKGTFQEVRDSIRTVGKAAQQAQKSAEQAEEYARSQILQLSNSIKLEVTNDTTGKKAVIKLSVPVGESGETAEYTGTIDLTGMVTFTNLEEEGATVINGGNIKTGTIHADTVKLTFAEGKSFSFDSVSELNTFVETEAANLTIHNMKTFGMTLYIDDMETDYGMYTAVGYTILELYVGADVDGFRNALAVLTLATGEQFYRKAFSEGEDDFTWYISKGRGAWEADGGKWSTLAVSKEYVDSNFAPAGHTHTAAAIGMPDVNTWLNNAGLVEEITVGGDKDTFYPVVIGISKDKTMPTYVSIYKNLGSATPDISGNHPGGTSSMWLIYECRFNGWDGNSGYIKTLYRAMPYAHLCADTRMTESAAGDLVVWLRGGNCVYKIARTNAGGTAICYEATNLGYGSYPYIVEPRTTLGNLGVTSNVPLGYGNIEGTATHANACDIPAGFDYHGLEIQTWGTLTAGNGYSPITTWAGNDGCAVCFAKRDGQASMQIDGCFYQREGQHRVLDTGDIADYVIAEQNTPTLYGNAYWTWRKWASGRVEMWGERSATLSIVNTWGNVTESEAIGPSTYPITLKFDHIWDIVGHVSLYSINVGFWTEVAGYFSAYTTPSVWAIRPSGATAAANTYYVKYYVSGFEA